MDVLQGVTIALLVLAALGGLLALAQRRGWAHFRSPGAGAARRMELVERLVLAPQQSLYLIRVDGRLLLVSSGPGGSSLRFADDDEAAR
jgi:flagellar biogenesis protein FliO